MFYRADWDCWGLWLLPKCKQNVGFHIMPSSRVKRSEIERSLDTRFLDYARNDDSRGVRRDKRAFWPESLVRSYFCESKVRRVVSLILARDSLYSNKRSVILCKYSRV